MNTLTAIRAVAPRIYKILLTAEEVGELLSMPPKRVMEYARGTRKPVLPSLKDGRYRKFRPADVENFTRQLQNR